MNVPYGYSPGVGNPVGGSRRWVPDLANEFAFMMGVTFGGTAGVTSPDHRPRLREMSRSGNNFLDHISPPGTGYISPTQPVGPLGQTGSVELVQTNTEQLILDMSGNILKVGFSIPGPEVTDIPWLRQRQRDDALRVWGTAKNNPTSKQRSLRQGWKNTYL
jgi:hypothetical protein